MPQVDHSPRRLGALSVCLLALGTCASEPGRSPDPPPEPTEEVAFDRGLRDGWRDHGWAPRDLEDGAPAALNLSEYGGWIVGTDELDGAYTALTLKLKAPSSFGDFLQVSLLGPSGERLRSVDLTGGRLAPGADGYADVRIAMSELNPDGKPFARVELRAKKRVGPERVLVQKVALVRAPGSKRLAVAEKGPPARPAAAAVDCAASFPISPGIYGIAFDPRLDKESQFVWEMKPTGRRWGGNPASRFNWEIDAWNTGSDWFFRNVKFDGDWRSFLRANKQRGVASTLTVPMMGWVAKDHESASFPTTTYGKQQQMDPDRPTFGNGVGIDGAPLRSPNPTTTSRKIDAAYVEQWVRSIEKGDVTTYILDNEPALWNSTHRDVHPEPAGYDEVLQKSLATAQAIKRADPQAFVAGPAEWGWTGYFYSAKDAAAGFHKKPDRLAHDDVPFLDWYLMKMRAAEEKGGKRLLDALTVHFYPQGQNVYSDAADLETAKLRVRQTRGLWDPTYVDESWIKEEVRLLPRLQEMIAARYPGTKLMIDEWSFGGEGHVSGALAVAEALGRFGAHGVHAAYYWTYPKKGTPAFEAFRAYRDYDGKGGRFLDRGLKTTSGEGVSVFASRDDDKVVLVVLNMDDAQRRRARIELPKCGVQTARAWRLTGEQPFLLPVDKGARRPTTGDVLDDVLPPWSLTVYELAR